MPSQGSWVPADCPEGQVLLISILKFHQVFRKILASIRRTSELTNLFLKSVDNDAVGGSPWPAP